MKLISKDTYPLLHKCWMTIRLDNGMVNRYEPEECFFTIESVENLNKAEHELLNLTPEMLENYCIGEESLREQIKKEFNLETTDYILNEWFN